MNQFTFEGKQKSTLLGFALVGLVCLILSFFMDEADQHHMRFWSTLLLNTVYFTGISFIALFVLAAFTTAWAGWYVNFKRVWEAYSLFLIVGLVFLCIIILGVWFHWHHLYHWAVEGIDDPTNPNYDRIIAGKSGFLNKWWYTLGTIGFVGIWYLFAKKMRSISVAEDSAGFDSAYSHHRSYKKWAATLLPIAAFSSAAMIWQWVMSIDSHWYSTMFAWYSTASWFVGMIALTIMMLLYLKGKGYFESVTDEHIHDLGKYLFAFSIFWTYLWFSQFMLIWYANNGEETVYFHLRRNDYTVLFFANLVINFLIPFLVLMRNDTKRKYGTLWFVAIVTFFGHWLDFFQMIKPGAYAAVNGLHGAAADHGAGHDMEHTADGFGIMEHADHAAGFVSGYTLPGFLDLGVFIGFTALFIYVAFYHLSKASLQPKNDPYLEEALHHHV